MISQLAQMFSSQGVLIQGTQYAFEPRTKKPLPDPNDLQNPADSFAAKFDQAAFKLELSKQGTEKQLSEEQEEQVKEMARRDREVHAHEKAHIARGGGAVQGGPNFEYKTGPDGKAYAVGGHVKIDASSVSGNPEATFQKSRAIQSAAMAPEDPSGQDLAVAAAALKMAADARAKMADEQATKEPGKAPAKSDDPREAGANKFQQARAAYAKPSATNGRAFTAFA